MQIFRNKTQFLSRCYEEISVDWKGKKSSHLCVIWPSYYVRWIFIENCKARGVAKLNTHLSRPKKNANKVDFWIEPRKKLGQQFIRILAISHKFCRRFRGFLISFSIQGSAGYYVCLIIIDIVAYKAVFRKITSLSSRLDNLSKFEMTANQYENDTNYMGTYDTSVHDPVYWMYGRYS